MDYQNDTLIMFAYKNLFIHVTEHSVHSVVVYSKNDILKKKQENYILCQKAHGFKKRVHKQGSKKGVQKKGFKKKGSKVKRREI